ncbi:hypothetical protein ACYEVC_000020 [Salmonella enterica]
MPELRYMAWQHIFRWKDPDDGYTRPLPLCQKLHEAGESIRVAEHQKNSALPQPCLTEEQADRIRAAHWAGFTGRRAGDVKVLPGGGQQSFKF